MFIFLKILIDCKKELVNKLQIDEKNIELSMGMSHDFEQAVSYEVDFFSYLNRI